LKGQATTRQWVALALLCLGACNPEGRPGPERGSTVTILTYGDERLRNWGMAGRQLVFLTLVRDSTEAGLACGWDHEPGTRTWTYHLRSDVRWHDGVPVTAHDIAFTMDLFLHLAVTELMPGGMSYRVQDDSTITFTYDQIQGSAYPLDEWTVFFPRHLLEGLDPESFSEWEFWTRPVGNGPYRYVRHIPKVMVELEANPDFFAGPPAIEHVILRFGGNALTELRAGNVDAMATYSGLSIEDLRVLDSRFKAYYSWDAGRRLAIFWNHRSPFFSDVRVRRALTLALDRRSLAAAQSYPDEVPLFDVPLSPGLLSSGDYLEPLPYDTAEAMRLLEEAGWRDLNGDGIRERDGVDFRFTLMASLGYAVQVREQYRRVGVLMDIHPIAPDVGRERLETGDFEAAYDIQRNNWGGGLWAETPEECGWGYLDARMSELYRRSRLVENWVDGALQDSLYLGMAAIFRRDQPITFLLPEIRFAVAHERDPGTAVARPLRPVAQPLSRMDRGGRMVTRPPAMMARNPGPGV
jgi:peptide/nickel transport system substrate-binding protein